MLIRLALYFDIFLYLSLFVVCTVQAMICLFWAEDRFGYGIIFLGLSFFNFHMLQLSARYLKMVEAVLNHKPKKDETEGK